jgi:hypothetical protein
MITSKLFFSNSTLQLTSSGAAKASSNLPPFSFQDFWYGIKSTYNKQFFMAKELQAFEGGERGDEEQDFALLRIARVQEINQALWQLIQQPGMKGRPSPAIKIDSEQFKNILLAIAIDPDSSKPSGADIIDQLGWAMLSYASCYCHDKQLRKNLIDTVESYLLPQGPAAVSGSGEVLVENMAARLFLLGQADFTPSAEFLAPMMKSIDAWELFSILACPRVSAELLRSVITRDFEDNVFDVLDQLELFKHFALLSENDDERLGAALVRLGVYDGPAASAYKLLCGFLEDAEQDMKGAARTFEEKAIALIATPGRLSELCQIDIEEYGGEFLTSVFDMFAGYFSLRFYRVLFLQFDVSNKIGFFATLLSQEVQNWVFNFKCMREFNFLKGEVPIHEMLEIIVGLNNPRFNEALFAANDQLGPKDNVECDGSAMKSPVGQDSKVQVYPLFSALTSFKPRENASRHFLAGLEKLILTMLLAQTFKVENYFSQIDSQPSSLKKATRGLSLKALAKDAKENVNSESFFHGLPEVNLAMRLQCLICNEGLVGSDYFPFPLAEEEMNVELIESAFQSRYVDEIYKLMEHQKRLMGLGKTLSSWTMVPQETERLAVKIIKKKLAAIFSIVAQLPVENIIRLNEQAPHFVMLSMAHNIYQCIAALNVQKGRSQSIVGGMFNKLKGSSGDNKQARVKLLTYISNHLAEALAPASGGEIPFLFSAYYFIELKPNNFVIENACPGESQEQQMAARQAISAEQSTAQQYYTGNQESMTADVQQWLKETIFVASASTLPLIAKPLALLPNDYLDGLFQSSGLTKQQIRKMVFPTSVAVDVAVLDNQETFIRATMAMADVSIEEDLKGGAAMADASSVAALIVRMDGDLYASAATDAGVPPSVHIEL